MLLNGAKKPLLGLLSITLAILGWAATSWVRMVEEHIRDSSAGYQRIMANEVRVQVMRQEIVRLEERVRTLEGRPR